MQVWGSFLCGTVEMETQAFSVRIASRLARVNQDGRKSDQP